MIGTNSPISFCEISELLRICVDRVVRGIHRPDHRVDELALQVGLAETWASMLWVYLDGLARQVAHRLTALRCCC